MIKTINVMGYDVCVELVSLIKIESNKKKIINTINAHSYMTATKNKVFKDVLKNSDILLPDGSGIILAAKYLKNRKIKKIAGYDLHMHLLKELNEKGMKCFYMGSSEETLKKIHDRISVDFPNIKVGYYSPPYTDTFTETENNEILQAINQFNPDVLFVGMTAPKQEVWLNKNKDKIDFKIAASIGAVFDFYAGSIKRPSRFWIENNLEWLPRLIFEPKRLWRRNFISTPLFIWHMILDKSRN